MKKIVKAFLILIIIFSILTLYRDVYYKPYTRICSWNIEFFGLVDIEDNSQSYYQETAKRILINDPSIVCLQEVSSVTGAKFLLEYLPGYRLIISDKISENNSQLFNSSTLEDIVQSIGSDVSDGIVNRLLMNCFLVKKDIHVKEFSTIHPRCIKMTYFDKHIENGEDVTIYNFHLPSNYIKNNSQTRKEILHKFIYTIDDPKETNIVLCGDFNALKSSDEIAILTDHHFYDSCEIIQALPYQKNNTHPFDKWSTMTWNDPTDTRVNMEGRKNTRVDYFFVSKHMYRHVLGGFTDKTHCNGNLGDLMGEISDHCAIYLDLS